jgi:pyruvate kinase
MSVVRLNLSHGSRTDHQSLVDTVRKVSEKLGVTIGILADLPGPKYRVGVMAERDLDLQRNASFTLYAAPYPGTIEGINVWPIGLHSDVRRNAKILLDEGKVELRVVEVSGQDIVCQVTRGGLLRDNKAVTAPGNTSTLDYFTDETVAALEFALDVDVDFIGLSYIRDITDLKRVKERVRLAGRSCLLVSKIEIKQAVDNLDSILDASDAVMVARGDLGVELPIEMVPGVQKRIIRRANERGKPVITATQMLESMIESSTPTRAEATDVHNAVRDGTDAIMLSGETSVGRHPVRVVQYMARIAKWAEKFLDYEQLARRRQEYSARQDYGVGDAIAYSAVVTGQALGAKVILAFTESGTTPSRVAAFRPQLPVISLSRNPQVGRRLSLRWGVVPLIVPYCETVQDMFYEGSELAIQTGYGEKGDTAIAVVGMPIGIGGSTNLLRVITLPEPKSHVRLTEQA